MPVGRIPHRKLHISFHTVFCCEALRDRLSAGCDIEVDDPVVDFDMLFTFAAVASDALDASKVAATATPNGTFMFATPHLNAALRRKMH